MTFRDIYDLRDRIEDAEDLARIEKAALEERIATMQRDLDDFRERIDALERERSPKRRRLAVPIR